MKWQRTAGKNLSNPRQMNSKDRVRRLARPGIALLLFLAGVWLIPHRWCSRDSGDWYRGDPAVQKKLAAGVEQWIIKDLQRDNYSTGNRQFNGEWLFGTYLMAGLGYGQTALEHPEWRTRHLQLMEHCIDRILTPGVRAFDRESWRNDPIDSLDEDSDHAAYLGYFNLLLSLHRLLEPKSKYSQLNDRITEALCRRIHNSRTGLLSTYPGETYPVDNCAVIASIGLHDRATGTNHRELLMAWEARLREKYIDPTSGLLFQAVDSLDGSPIDAPRGSGTTLGAYLLSFSHPGLSRELHMAVKRQLFRTCLGFGAVREYPVSFSRGRGDIDSGPVLFGIGISPTGFLVSTSRIFGDRSMFSDLYGTVDLFGAPLDGNNGLTFVTGGPIGNAIMFAMLTAQPEDGRTDEARPLSAGEGS